MSKGHKAAGGIASKNVTHKPVRTGTPKQRIVPSGVAQIGQRQGNHVTEQGATGYGGINPMSGKAGFPSELGNTVAASTQCGPGGSRNIYARGTQGVQGAPAPGSPMPAQRGKWPI